METLFDIVLVASFLIGVLYSFTVDTTMEKILTFFITSVYCLALYGMYVFMNWYEKKALENFNKIKK